MYRYQVKTIMNAHTQDDTRFANEQDARDYYTRKLAALRGWSELGHYRPSTGDTISLNDLETDETLLAAWPGLSNA